MHLCSPKCRHRTPFCETQNQRTHTSLLRHEKLKEGLMRTCHIEIREECSQPLQTHHDLSSIGVRARSPRLQQRLALRRITENLTSIVCCQPHIDKCSPLVRVSQLSRGECNFVKCPAGHEHMLRGCPCCKLDDSTGCMIPTWPLMRSTVVSTISSWFCRPSSTK